MQLPKFSVFLKPWSRPLAQLAPKIKELGLDGVELPVRPGFAINPDNALEALPDAVRILSDHGLRVYSVASDLDEGIFRACAGSGVPLVRICEAIPKGKGYLEAEALVKKRYAAMVPLLEKYGVSVGIQNHCDRWVSNAMGLRRLVEGFDPRHFCAVWDAAHAALCGEDCDLGLDIVWSHLRMVNLKNAYWRRVSGPEGSFARWEHYWTGGRHGLALWPQVVRELAKRSYSGPVCFTAEYSDGHAVDRLIAEDIRFAKELFSEEYQKIGE